MSMRRDQDRPDSSRQQSDSVNWIFGLVVVIGVILCSVGVLIYVNGQLQNAVPQKTSDTAQQPPKSVSDPNRLNVSAPIFTSAGISFTLNDDRPNSSLWVSVKVGRGSADKNFMSWISLSGARSGAVSISFRDCKYLDEGLYSLASASKCEVTIGAKLKDNDKIVYTKYDTPISELRTSLANAAR
jgi:hypothetical protein